MPDAVQGAPGDGLDELRPDDVPRREVADERPSELEPVLDAHLGPAVDRHEAPGDPHPLRHAAGVHELDGPFVTQRALHRLPC